MTFNESQATVLLSTSQTNSREILNQSTELSTPNICQVCGNKARCFNYGAITCLSCRAFFRRHGIRSKVCKGKKTFHYRKIQNNIFLSIEYSCLSLDWPMWSTSTKSTTKNLYIVSTREVFSSRNGCQFFSWSGAKRSEEFFSYKSRWYNNKSISIIEGMSLIRIILSKL